jgi:hypothetical protein
MISGADPAIQRQLAGTICASVFGGAAAFFLFNSL